MRSERPAIEINALWLAARIGGRDEDSAIGRRERDALAIRVPYGEKGVSVGREAGTRATIELINPNVPAEIPSDGHR